MINFLKKMIFWKYLILVIVGLVLNFAIFYGVIIIAYSFPRLDLDHRLNEEHSKKLYFLTDNISKTDKDKLEKFAEEYQYDTIV